MKKLISLLIVATMLLSLIPLSLFSVSAEDVVTDSQGLAYTLSADGTYYIISDFYIIISVTVTEVVIPEEYNGLPVKEIGNKVFYYCSGLTSIEIPDSITSIGKEAFYGCESLTSIEIPNSVKSIGERAFEGCDSLTSIKIPDSVTSIGSEAFIYCESLTSIEIPNSVTSISGSVFFGCYDLADIYCEAESQPDGWHENWTYRCNATVHWGCEMTNSSNPVLGNIDGDNDVDSLDYLFVKRAVLNTYTLTAEQKSAADIDKDGDVDSLDYLFVKRMVLGTYTVK